VSAFALRGGLRRGEKKRAESVSDDEMDVSVLEADIYAGGGALLASASGEGLGVRSTE